MNPTPPAPTHPIPPALVLQDIHLPDPISWWPPALGWWLLMGGISTTIAMGWFVWYRVQRNRLRKAALSELDRLVTAHATHQDDHRLTGELSALLRRVCLSPLWRPKGTGVQPDHIAGLTGEAWLHFLDQTWPERPFSTGVGRQLIALPFQQPTTPPLEEKERAALIALCRTWLHLYAISGKGTGRSS